MSDETWTEWVCESCYFQLAGYDSREVPDLADAPYPYATDDSVRVTLGAMYGADGCEHEYQEEGDHDAHIEQCETQAFSWRTCDGCGNVFGGSRHAVTLRVVEP